MASIPISNQSSSHHACYVPHDLKYQSDFEDSLIHAVLHSNGTSNGIHIIPDDSPESPVDGVSVRQSSIDPSILPHIPEHQLPLPLNDHRRIYASALPGVKVTHPFGYLEGGPGLEPDMDTFPDDFLQNHPHVSTPAQLRKAVAKEVENSVEALKERLRARQKAKERNEQIEKELKALRDQHSLEMKVHERMQAERAQKKEARERKRRERDGG